MYNPFPLYSCGNHVCPHAIAHTAWASFGLCPACSWQLQLVSMPPPPIYCANQSCPQTFYPAAFGQILCPACNLFSQRPPPPYFFYRAAPNPLDDAGKRTTSQDIDLLLAAASQQPHSSGAAPSGGLCSVSTGSDDDCRATKRRRQTTSSASSGNHPECAMPSCKTTSSLRWYSANAPSVAGMVCEACYHWNNNHQ
jgi:hypothetical protein